MKGRRGNPGLRGRLLNNSVDAYILALETINRLSTQYRLEAFCFLICNAWELLLKAKILDDSGNNRDAIYRRKRGGERRKTLSLGECIARVTPSDTDAERRNIELVNELRDEAAHLVVGAIPREILSLFQASVVNYHKRLNEWFGISLSERVPAGMMSIVYDIPPQDADMSGKRLRRTLGRETAAFLADFGATVKAEFDRLQRPAEFSISVDYRLVLSKTSSEGDIVLSTGAAGATPAGIIEVPKDPGRSHPLRETEVLARFRAAAPGAPVNRHDIRCAISVYHVKKRPEYFYQSTVKGSPKQYSQKFVDWLIKQYQRDPEFFQMARQKAKAPA